MIEKLIEGVGAIAYHTYNLSETKRRLLNEGKEFLGTQNLGSSGWAYYFMECEDDSDEVEHELPDKKFVRGPLLIYHNSESFCYGNHMEGQKFHKVTSLKLLLANASKPGSGFSVVDKKSHPIFDYAIVKRLNPLEHLFCYDTQVTISKAGNGTDERMYAK